MSEFSNAISEAFGVLAGAQLGGGETWVVKDTGLEFRGIQARSEGSFEQIVGGTDFKREVHLSCTRDDFAGGYPAKKTIIYRKAAPNVLYFVKEDVSAESDIAPTFSMTLALKHG